MGCLSKLRQIGPIKEFIASFEELAIRIEGLVDAFYIECFINGLKEAIHPDVHIQRPTTWLESRERALEA